jgi:predicted dehydrogenase
MMDDRLRLGLIGCGGMAGSHLRGFDLLRDRLVVAATADVVLERAERAAQAVGAERAVTDYRELLDDVDAALIALPHHLHYEAGMACLEAGAHVLMEKPLALDETQCLALIHAAQEREQTLMVAYCMRFHPLVVRFKELLDRHAYGDVFHISIWTEQHTQRPPDHWISSAATLGGGQLFSHGCHYIDLLLWFLGRPVRGVHVGTNYGTPWMEREGTSNVTIEFESGALGYHMGTWGAKGTRHGYNLQAHCTEGMLEADISAGKLYAHVGREAKLLFELGQAPDLKHTYLEMAHFYQCVRSNSTPLTDGPGSLQGLRVIWRLYEAEERGAMADLRGLGLDQAWDWVEANPSIRERSEDASPQSGHDKAA